MKPWLQSLRGSLLVLGLVGLHFHSFAADPRPPLPPWPEIFLYHWSFDEPYTTPALLAPTPSQIGKRTFDPPSWLPSWNGYSFNRQGLQVQPIQLPLNVGTKYPTMGYGTGTLRFWYCPGWTSGQGPGTEARLLEFVTGSGKDSVPWWGLRISTDGNLLNLVAQTEKGMEDQAKVNIQWQAGQWHLLALDYSPTNTTLLIDAQVVAEGPGLCPVPDNAWELSGLLLGSDALGQNVAQGQFEDLTSFHYQYPASLLGVYYRAYQHQADLGPIVSSDQEKRATMDQTRVAETMQALMEGDEFNYPLAQTGLRLTLPIIPATNTSIAFLTLLDAPTNKSYDIFFVPALGLTNTAWNSIAARGASGQTNFTVSLTNSVGFFQAFDNDLDNDGFLNYLDANSHDTNIGTLTITIDFPRDGDNLD